MVTAASDSRGYRRAAGLEPQHAGREDPLGGESLADAGRDGPEILTDDEGARPLALQRQDGKQVVGGVADIGPAPGRCAPGDPEQPEEPHDVVDAHPAGVTEPGPHRVDERPVPRGAEPVGHERRQSPVLPLEREVVGRRPHRDAPSQHVLPRPGVGALAIETDGQVGHQAKCPPGSSQLLVEQPLEPGVKSDPLPLLGGEARDGGGRGMPVLDWPAPPPRPVTLSERAEDRELLQASTLASAIASEPIRARGSRAPTAHRGPPS